MDQSFGDRLRTRTAQAHEIRRVESLESIERHTRTEQADLQARQLEIDAFVSRFLTLAVHKITVSAEGEADFGRPTSETVWSFRNSSEGELPELDLEKHRALRDRAIEQLNTMGVVATSIDRSLIEHDVEQPFVTEEVMPTEVVGHEIGVRLTWSLLVGEQG